MHSECRTKKPLIRNCQTRGLKGADSRRGTNDGQLYQHGMLKIYMKCYENHHPFELGHHP